MVGPGDGWEGGRAFPVLGSDCPRQRKRQKRMLPALCMPLPLPSEHPSHPHQTAEEGPMQGNVDGGMAS